MTGPKRRRGYVLNAVHVALAAFLLVISLLAHGRVPGLSADASAALGFLFFFGLGVPVLVVAAGTFVWSLFTGERRLVALAGSLLVTALSAMANVWTGLVASLGYLSFGVWALVRRERS